ncbi:MAG: SpoIIE family protein phosphatase [Phycisphaerales bacterium]|nr:SpoIIE family protein phosphatase [Phycisphaerales bacterium]
MKIRWKMLILLAGTGLLPLALMTTYSQTRGRELGLELAEEARGVIIDAAKRELQQIVDTNGELLWQQGETITLGVRMQAREVERLLASPLPNDPRIVPASRFDDESDLPAGAILSSMNLEADADGAVRSMYISRDTQAYHLAPGVRQSDVADDIARLAPMTSLYASLREDLDEHLRWQYTALESGVHTTYPGHGGYPAQFDPRVRPWYIEAKEVGADTWSVAIVDATTRQVVIPVVAPVHDRDGAFAGVTGADVPLADLLHIVDLPDEWRDSDDQTGTQVMVCILHPREETGEIGLGIWLYQGYGAAELTWDVPIDLAWFEADEPDEQAALVEDLLREQQRLLDGLPPGESTARRLRYNGRDYFWAHRQSAEYPEVLIVVLVPYDEVVEEAVLAEAAFRAQVIKQMGIMLGVGLIVAVGIAIAALVTSRMITLPVRRLAATARRVAEGDLSARASLSCHDEIGDLCAAFDTMVPKLRDRMQLRESLALAMEVQQNLLPSAPPTIPGLDIAGRSIYCDETGGDYYDFLDLAQLGPGMLGVAVGDVTGHGIAAALLMTTARALLRSRADLPGSLADVMTDINRYLAEDTLQGRFMTLFLLVIDERRHTIRWVSAGHDPAMCYDPAADEFDDLEGEDIPLGINGDWRYHEATRDIDGQGRVVVIGTDGIWESRNPEGAMYGKAALRAVIRSHALLSADEISRAITDDLAAFRGAGIQEDDVTLVVVKMLSG